MGVFEQHQDHLDLNPVGLSPSALSKSPWICPYHSGLEELSLSYWKDPVLRECAQPLTWLTVADTTLRCCCPIFPSTGVTWEHLRQTGFCLRRAQPGLHCTVGKVVHLSQPAFRQKPEMSLKVMCFVITKKYFLHIFFFLKNCLYFLNSPHTLSRVKPMPEKMLTSLLCSWRLLGQALKKLSYCFL